MRRSTSPNPAAFREAVAACGGEFGRLDVLVNADWNLIVRIAPCGMMDPRDVAKAIASLASDDAIAIHTAVYRVDNGKDAG
jgi:NAD(P)-dependent dehydrogenase (short-subunit alcohol dehydrogenase family)